MNNVISISMVSWYLVPGGIVRHRFSDMLRPRSLAVCCIAHNKGTYKPTLLNIICSTSTSTPAQEVLSEYQV